MPLLLTAVATAMLAGLGGTAAATEPKPPDQSTAGGPSCPAAAEDRRFDAATRDDAEFNATFEHGFEQVDDVTMHYVDGGRGHGP